MAAARFSRYKECDVLHAVTVAKAGNSQIEEPISTPTANRGDISARDMMAYLSKVQLFEVAKGGEDFLIRLIGTEFTEELGYDPTGCLVSELTDPILTHRMIAAAGHVVQTSVPICTSATARAVARVSYRRIEKIWLPLGSENDDAHSLSGDAN